MLKIMNSTSIKVYDLQKSHTNILVLFPTLGDLSAQRLAVASSANKQIIFNMKSHDTIYCLLLLLHNSQRRLSGRNGENVHVAGYVSINFR